MKKETKKEIAERLHSLCKQLKVVVHFEKEPTKAQLKKEYQLLHAQATQLGYL